MIRGCKVDDNEGTHFSTILKLSDSPIDCVASGLDLLAFSRGSEICLYSSEEDQRFAFLSSVVLGGPVVSLAFSLDSSLFAVTRDSVLWILSLDLRVLAKVEIPRCRGVFRSAGGDVLVYGTEGLLGTVIRDSNDKSISVVDLRPGSFDILCLCNCSEGLIAVGTNCGKILLLDNAHKRLHAGFIIHRNWKCPSQLMRIQYMCSVDVDEGLIAVGDNQGDITLYNVNQPELLAVKHFASVFDKTPVMWMHHCSARNCLFAMDSRGNLVQNHTGSDCWSFVVKSNFTFSRYLTCATAMAKGTLVFGSQLGDLHMAGI